MVLERFNTRYAADDIDTRLLLRLLLYVATSDIAVDIAVAIAL